MEGEAGSSDARLPGSPSDPAPFTDMFAPPKRSRAASFLARSTAAAPCAAASVVARAVAAVAAVRPEAAAAAAVGFGFPSLLFSSLCLASGCVDDATTT